MRPSSAPGENNLAGLVLDERWIGPEESYRPGPRPGHRGLDMFGIYSGGGICDLFYFKGVLVIPTFYTEILFYMVYMRHTGYTIQYYNMGIRLQI
ncbi:hypothetical protein CEXT_706191 [Caerostris extrusa]|uniref:Uncharacterized protein n=1 Tax=Caerostris extrusa TaxID=172846 RepID=A0AAV4XC53_CAEEX|nr:hypothetical protein CEXT_706191 [Caerostris extrusa]